MFQKIKDWLSKYIAPYLGVAGAIVFVVLCGVILFNNSKIKELSDQIDAEKTRSVLLQSANDANDLTIKQLRDQREIEGALILRNMAETAAVATEIQKTRDLVQKTKSENPNVKAYLDSPLPLAIICLLADPKTPGCGQDGNGQANTAPVTNPG
jgi:hypothetical protein